MEYLLFAEQPYAFSILRPLQEEIRKRGGTAYWFLFNLSSNHLTDDELLLTSVEDVKSKNISTVVAPGNWVPHFFPGLKVQIFHGFGIEKKGHFRIRGLFDLYCTHGPLTTRPFVELADQQRNFQVIETGWPKLDVKCLEYDGRTSFSPTTRLLYAPTFSPSLTSAGALFETMCDIAAHSQFELDIKFHPLMDDESVAQYKTIAGATVVEDAGTISALGNSDIVISDTSSIVAEALYLGKPVVTFCGTHTGDHTIDISAPSSLIPAINSIVADPEKYRSASMKYVNAMHPYRDGQSSARVLDAIDLVLESPNSNLKSKPLNFVRKLKINRAMRQYARAARQPRPEDKVSISR